MWYTYYDSQHKHLPTGDPTLIMWYTYYDSRYKPRQPVNTPVSCDILKTTANTNTSHQRPHLDHLIYLLCQPKPKHLRLVTPLGSCDILTTVANTNISHQWFHPDHVIYLLRQSIQTFLTGYLTWIMWYTYYYSQYKHFRLVILLGSCDILTTTANTNTSHQWPQLDHVIYLLRRLLLKPI